MIWLAIGIFIIIAALYGYKRWGASGEKKKAAEKEAKELKDDAKIASKPYIDKPFGRMRGKK